MKRKFKRRSIILNGEIEARIDRLINFLEKFGVRYKTKEKYKSEILGIMNAINNKARKDVKKEEISYWIGILAKKKYELDYYKDNPFKEEIAHKIYLNAIKNRIKSLKR